MVPQLQVMKLQTPAMEFQILDMKLQIPATDPPVQVMKYQTPAMELLMLVMVMVMAMVMVLEVRTRFMESVIPDIKQVIPPTMLHPTIHPKLALAMRLKRPRWWVQSISTITSTTRDKTSIPATNWIVL